MKKKKKQSNKQKQAQQRSLQLKYGRALITGNPVDLIVVNPKEAPVTHNEEKRLLSFGLFSFVINAAMLELTSRWSKHLDVKNFTSALLGSLLISAISAILGAITTRKPSL